MSVFTILFKKDGDIELLFPDMGISGTKIK